MVVVNLMAQAVEIVQGQRVREDMLAFPYGMDYS